MAKIKLTKNEFKNQKDQLKMFARYLPTLQLKKQQLQLEIRDFREKMYKVKIQQEELRKQLKDWIAVFGQPSLLDEREIVRVDKIETNIDNIAGVSIPTFKELSFVIEEFNLFEQPAWFASGIIALKQMVEFDAKVLVLAEAVRRLEQELLTTTQRVNLFEKIKIPETKANIKKIAVYLGDQQTASVIRGKMTKKKLQARVN